MRLSTMLARLAVQERESACLLCTPPNYSRRTQVLSISSYAIKRTIFLTYCSMRFVCLSTIVICTIGPQISASLQQALGNIHATMTRIVQRTLSLHIRCCQSDAILRSVVSGSKTQLATEVPKNESCAKLSSTGRLIVTAFDYPLGMFMSGAVL